MNHLAGVGGPMRSLAVIDVGSNATRLSVVKLPPVGRVIEEDFKRFPVRLGADTFSCGKIREERIDALTDVFREIAGHLERHGVESYRAVATSAVRGSCKCCSASWVLRLTVRCSQGHTRHSH